MTIMRRKSQACLRCPSPCSQRQSLKGGITHQKAPVFVLLRNKHSTSSPTVKLAIAVESATDLPARDYGAHCDPWVSVTVIRFVILVNVILVVVIM